MFHVDVSKLEAFKAKCDVIVVRVSNKGINPSTRYIRVRADNQKIVDILLLYFQCNLPRKNLTNRDFYIK